MNLAENLKAYGETLHPLVHCSKKKNTHTFAWDRTWATACVKAWPFQFNL